VNARPMRAPPKNQFHCSHAVPSEPVENSDNSEIRRIFCFPSHSGHRGLCIVRVPESASHTGRLSPKQHGRKRATWPRPKVAGAGLWQ
jgi:hypothetical protein